MRPRLLRLLAAIIGALPLGACGPIGAEVGAPLPPFVECQTDEFAFVGQSSLGALGLGEFAGPESTRVGQIWVTANPVPMNVGPMPGVAQPQPVEMARMVCVEWPDGGGMSSTIDEDWQLPAGVTGSDAQPASVPVGMIALGVGAVALAAISVIAFRRD
jgi:hypothetical protein